MGRIDLFHRRYYCGICKSGSIPMDQWAGVGKRGLTTDARRLITLAGTSWSFDRASKHLKEFCRLEVSDDTIERVCQEEGRRAAKWMKDSDDPAKAIAGAKGQIEFSSDGVKINTTQSWKEMRLTTVIRREAALPCMAEKWDQRVLNTPSARVSICAIANSEKIGASWRRLSRKLRLATEQVVHVIADGAKWIWEQAGVKLPKHNGKWCVDVYHVSQHIHQCGKDLFGESTRARHWADEHLKTALTKNGPALIQQIENQQAVAGEKQKLALEKLLTYLRPNKDRMWYADRLRDGQTIGSGIIEGGCKNTIGARLKLNSARWKIQRAQRIGMLRCIDASNLWPNFWNAAA